MLKYIQDQDFGVQDQSAVIRQKKIFDLTMPSQHLNKSRSVSQMLHEQLVSMQVQSTRRNKLPSLHQQPKLSNAPIEYYDPVAKQVQPIKPKIMSRKVKQQIHVSNEWSSDFLIDRGATPIMKDIKKALALSTAKTISRSTSNFIQSKQISPRQTSPLTVKPSNEKLIRCLLAENVISGKIDFNDLMPVGYAQVQDPDDMLSKVIANFCIMKQLFNSDKIIGRILLKIQGINRRIIELFFKQTKANCPNEIEHFEEYFKLRKNISKSLIIAKFIIGFEPSDDLFIRKVILNYDDQLMQLQHRHTYKQETIDQTQQIKQLKPQQLLQLAKELFFEFDFLNKLNYFNNNLSTYLQQKQLKVIQQKVSKSAIEITELPVFDQPDSLVVKINNCERRLGLFKKITHQERFKYLQADAYMHYR